MAEGKKLGRSSTLMPPGAKELKQSAERLQALIDEAPIGICHTDLAGKFTYVNKRFEEVSGYSREEVVGKSGFKLGMFSSQTLKLLGERIKDILMGRPPRLLETKFKCKDGHWIWVAMEGQIIRERGIPIGFQIIASDITERKQAVEELEEAQEQLIRAEKLASIGQLASGVGHELRNPLGAIKNAIFYVRRRVARSDLAATEPRVLEFLDIMDKEVTSANKVISDLLGFSRVAKPTVAPANIGGMIEDALKYVPMAENIKLTTDVDPGLPMVMVDADQVRQVFVNIILNAVEAMPEGGRLEIRARSKAQFVEVEFADSGGGIPESIIGKIFDPLFTTKAKGIGLGLAMSKSILERHGGNIQVKSEDGKGATFTASLPTQAV